MKKWKPNNRGFKIPCESLVACEQQRQMKERVRGEREADEDIKAGRVETLNSVEELIEELREVKK